MSSERNKLNSFEKLMFNKNPEDTGKPCRACVDFKSWRKKMTGSDKVSIFIAKEYLNYLLYFSSRNHYEFTKMFHSSLSDHMFCNNMPQIIS